MATVRNPNYKEIPDLIRNKVDFVHSHSMSAYKSALFTKYIVLSYTTVIAEYDWSVGRWTYFNERKYSVTTSKQQNIIRAIIAEQGGVLESVTA